MTNRTMGLCQHLGDLGLGCFRRTGEANDEGRAPVRLAIYTQRAVMRFDDCLRDTEPQSRSTCTLGREEGIKHPVPHLCRHPDSRVAYRHAYRACCRPSPEGDLPPLGHRFNGIQEQIGQDLAQFGRPPEDAR
jgi:hypothetical protein